MSWIRLLALGRSVKGVDRDTERYEVQEQEWLPKFESSRRGGDGRLQPIPLPDGTCATPARPPQVKGPIGVFRRLFNRMCGGRRRGQGGGERHVVNGAPLVQGVLSLEKVTVARNDLLDSDLEVVASRAERASGKWRAGDKTGSKRFLVGWAQLANRIARAVRSLFC